MKMYSRFSCSPWRIISNFYATNIMLHSPFFCERCPVLTLLHIPDSFLKRLHENFWITFEIVWSSKRLEKNAVSFAHHCFCNSFYLLSSRTGYVLHMQGTASLIHSAGGPHMHVSLYLHLRQLQESQNCLHTGVSERVPVVLYCISHHLFS